MHCELTALEAAPTTQTQSIGDNSPARPISAGYKAVIAAADKYQPFYADDGYRRSKRRV
jgi:hypothetical protein